MPKVHYVREKDGRIIHIEKNMDLNKFELSKDGIKKVARELEKGNAVRRKVVKI